MGYFEARDPLDVLGRLSVLPAANQVERLNREIRR